MKKYFFSLLFLCLVFSAGSANAAPSWQQISEPQLLSTTSGATSIAIDSQGAVYVAYQEFYTRDSLTNSRIMVDKYQNDVMSSLGHVDYYDYYDNFSLKVNSNDELYLAFQDRDYTSTGSGTNFGAFVTKYNNGSWEAVGQVGNNGFLNGGEQVDGLRFEIGLNDSLYVAYKDASTAEVKVLEYTGNVTSDTDERGNDGWELAFEDISVLSNVNYFDFSIGSDGIVYLLVNKNLGTVSTPDYKTFLYKYDNSWTSLRSTPFEAGNESYHLQAYDNGFYLYLNEEISAASSQNKILHYTNSSGSWQTITSGTEEFLDDTYNFKYFGNGTPFTLDADGDLNIVYGNTDASLQDWNNPWGSATVMKYDGGQWSYVGSKRFSEQSSMYFSVAASGDGLYVVCRDGGANDEKATVYKFGETESEPVEPPASAGDGSNVADDSGEYGPSPVTGQQEAISEVSADQFIRSYSFNSIYYIDEDLVRHPFWDANTFFTYADSWSEVFWVTDATLSTLTMGSPMLPKEGVVLVKIQSDPKVYAIDSDNTLRWVPDEATANSLYGSAWADYVIDLEPTTMARFSTGENMTTGDSVSQSQMKTRFDLVDTP